MNDYEGRIYDRANSCGTEWWSMNAAVQRMEAEPQGSRRLRGQHRDLGEEAEPPGLGDGQEEIPRTDGVHGKSLPEARRALDAERLHVRLGIERTERLQEIILVQDRLHEIDAEIIDPLRFRTRNCRGVVKWERTRSTTWGFSWTTWT